MTPPSPFSPADALRRAKILIERKIAQGRGRGRGSEYAPWLEVREVSSEGLSSRVKGWKSHRVHHFLSSLELNYFYCLEYADDVVDVREQYPLDPIEETLAIAEQCGIKHPFDNRKRMPVMMTTDFLVTTSTGMTSTDWARTVKPAARLADRRVLEKFQIERMYWQRRGINWGIVTERDISTTVAKNVFWMHLAHDLADCGVTQDQLWRVEQSLRLQMLSGSTTSSMMGLGRLCAECDDRLGFKPGDSIMIVRHLLARKKWRVDIFRPIEIENALHLEGLYPDTPSRGN